MKIQIDTIEKTIKVEGSVNLGELIKEIGRMLPDAWKDYTLIMEPVIVNPININPIPIYPVYPRPWSEPFYKWPEITCMTGYNENKK